MQTFITILLLIVSVLLIVVILMQPDKSQTTAKTMASITQEKDGMDKFTEYLSILFIVLAIALMIVNKLSQ